MVCCQFEAVADPEDRRLVVRRRDELDPDR
jgi:hypothetical protein